MNCANGACYGESLLIDTHPLLWWFNRHLGSLSVVAGDAIAEAQAPVFVSSVRAFEIPTKNAIGKLRGVDLLLASFEHRIAAEGFLPLPVEMRHALAVAALSLHHRDPFDRLLLAQALVDDLTIVSIDERFDAHSVRHLW
ncbi:type II toxin-antitoxin system VapC family toxin [Sphingomonas sp.]|uniref:type II toxin-antitoxin system VapC family toxin n=1 Tax=Sphingomonas sp. TaxID=28214 RepID=UPI003CC5EDC5